MQSTGFLDALAAIYGFWAVWWVLQRWAELPEKWGFESGGAARILPLCAPARPTAFLQTENGRAAVRVGGSLKRLGYWAAVPPQKRCDAVTPLLPLTG